MEMAKKKRLSVIIGYFLALILSFLVFTPYFIAEMRPKFEMRFWADAGIAYHFYLLYFFFYVFYSSLILFCHRNKVSGVKREQLRYILAGMILSFIGGSTNYFLWYDINIPPYGNIFASSFVVFTAYAMITKRFLGATIVVRKFGVYLFSVWTLAIFALFVKIKFRFLDSVDYFYFDILLIIVCVFLFKYIKKFYYFIANKYFFYSLYDPGTSISSISKKMMTTIKPTVIYDFIFNEFVRIFMIKTFIILKDDSSSESFDVVYSRGSQQKVKKFKKDKYLEREYFNRNEPVVKAEVSWRCLADKNGQGICGPILKDAEIIFPLVLKNKVIGLMLVGPKASGDFYTSTDINTLKVISTQLASAMESRELYDKINVLNRSLKKKVQEQTAEILKKAEELKQKNNRLKNLLEVKNDFLRIVNHQLNTPISIIKNSTYMIKSRSFTQERGLSFIQEGVKRMEETIHDFWKAFSFEGESPKIVLKKTYIEDIVDKIVSDSLEMPEVKERKLKIKVKKEFPIPSVLCDPKEINQVLFNLLDNAISYTKNGGVDVYYKKDGKFLKVYVKDTGCGIIKDEADSLFDKFTRGKRAIGIRPGGSGLGLYIARKIIEACGGKLVLEESTPDKGSTFSFTVLISK
jgi:signal transduction histidine kinase